MHGISDAVLLHWSVHHQPEYVCLLQYGQVLRKHGRPRPDELWQYVRGLSAGWEALGAHGGSAGNQREQPQRGRAEQSRRSGGSAESDSCSGPAGRRRRPLTLKRHVLAACVGVLMCSMADVGKSAGPAAAVSNEIQTSPLHRLGTAPFSQDRYLAWAGPALCDEDENAYFLTVPHSPVSAEGAPVVDPRDVLRVSGDGKKQVTFSPAASTKFVSAAELKTKAIALGRHGTVFLLIWARWGDNGGQAEKSGQYIVSFNAKGEYQSHFEVDWREMLIHEFDVFGSGEFLLRGRRAEAAESRLAILSASGRTLQDVVGSSAKPSEEPSPEITPRFDHMARGGDGRIYLTEYNAEQDRTLIYAISESGESEQVFKLRPMWKDAQLMGWKAADDRFAAVYLVPERRPDASSEEQSGLWWIAVYSHAVDEAEPPTVYGPAPGPPICYKRRGSMDRFTFVTDGGKFLTMSSR